MFQVSIFLRKSLCVSQSNPGVDGGDHPLHLLQVNGKHIITDNFRRYYLNEINCFKLLVKSFILLLKCSEGIKIRDFYK